MGHLKRLLKDLREEVERLGSRAPAAPGEIDVTRLEDPDLARLDELLAHLQANQGRDPGRTHRPGKDTERRGWACGCALCKTPPGTEPPLLSGDDLRELAGLLDRARVPARGTR